MTIQEFIDWMNSLDYFKDWNWHYTLDCTSTGEFSHLLLATKGDKCWHFRRKSIADLVAGINLNIETNGAL